MIQELRLSAPNKVTIAPDGSFVQFFIPNTTTPLNADYTVNWTDADEVTYALGGTDDRQIIRTDQAGKETVMANDITSLFFTGDANPPHVVTVTVNLQRQMTNERQMTATPLQLSAKAELRNV